MVSIKHKILQLWDSAPPTVRICCIKFAQRVVLAQTVASGAEHRVRKTIQCRCKTRIIGLIKHVFLLSMAVD
jgi:hypothetical protein